MTRWISAAVALILLAYLSAATLPGSYPWNLPRGFPPPPVPAGNPMSPAKVQLGRCLFYDRRLSVNGTTSCASCHRQELAFTDGRAVPTGATGEPHHRSAMSLVNVAYSRVLTWSDPRVQSLESQALIPLLGTHPVEMGLAGRTAELVSLLRSERVYCDLFPAAFPAEPDPFTLANVAKAIAAFERTIISGRSSYDRYRYGDANAISDSAKRGELLFFLDGTFSCFRCHGGFNFSDAAASPEAPRLTLFHNTGLYNLRGPSSYPAPNVGLYQHTGRPSDMGRFKAPTLRNIVLTAPYMHDGSIATLEEVVDHYAAGGRTIAAGPLAGIGRDNPAKDKLVSGFPMTRQNRADLVDFLRSLTDENLIHDPRFSDPWQNRSRKPEYNERHTLPEEEP